MTYLNKLSEVNSNERNVLQIIYWWELRRILYNLIVLFAGIISLLVMSFVVNVPEGEDLVEPFAILGFGIISNLCYTLGWITEIFRKKDEKYGPKMFKKGLYLTLLFTLLPMVIHLIIWLIKEIQAI